MSEGAKGPRSQYVGEWQDNKPGGHGTFIDTSGGKYVGEYRDDKKHGQGTYFFADGRVWHGLFRNGEWDSGQQYAAGQVPPEVYAFIAAALPPCPTDPSAYFHNCEGNWTAPNGDKYVGGWRDWSCPGFVDSYGFG